VLEGLLEKAELQESTWVTEPLPAVCCIIAGVFAHGWLAENCFFPVPITLLPSLNMTTTNPLEWGHLKFLIYVLFTAKLM
jgi:hypothetical protein